MFQKHAVLQQQAEAEASSGSSSTRQPLGKHEFDEETGDYIITFADGQKLELNVFQLPQEMQKRLMFHGLRQKTGDSYAGAKGNASVARQSASDVIEQLKNGEWTGGRDGEARPRLGELAEAVAAVKGMDLEKAKEAINKIAALEGSEEEKKAGKKKLDEMRAHPKIKAAIAKAKAEKAQKELEAAAGAADFEI